MGFGLRHFATAVLLVAAVAACGKKGPPLSPIVRIPAAAEIASAQRAGSDVYVTLTIPVQNLDATMPASVARVDLYAATSLTPPSRARFLDIATLVGTIPVAPAADPGDPRAPVPPPDPKAGALQGAAATIRETLSPAEMKPRELPELPQNRRGSAQVALAVAPPPALRRFYMAIPVSDRNRAGPPSMIVEVPLTVALDPPIDLRAAMTPTDIALQWEPSGGLLGWLMDQARPIEPSPVQAITPAATTPAGSSSELPPGPTGYNVYRQIAPDPLVLPTTAGTDAAWDTPAPVPLNAAPLAALTYSDPIVLDERERCYHVRAVRGSGAQRVESEPSNGACVLPIDIEPPLTPTALTPIAVEGSISLSWEPNGEEDLGGYIILRGEPGSATLLQLTASPIIDTRYTDSTVRAGVRYTYYVSAVDSRVPLPNASEPAEVSETAQ